MVFRFQTMASNKKPSIDKEVSFDNEGEPSKSMEEGEVEMEIQNEEEETFIIESDEELEREMRKFGRIVDNRLRAEAKKKIIKNPKENQKIKR